MKKFFNVSFNIKKASSVAGILAVLTLTACGTSGNSPKTPEPSVTSSASDISTPSSSPSTSAAETKRALPYPRLSPGSTTMVGEPLEDAEARFVKAAQKKAVNGESDAELLDIGYQICGFYFNSDNMSQVYQKIEDASNGDKEQEIFLVTASGYAMNTICPEYSDFS